jgi:cobalt/nickel transport system permease protein
MHIPDGFLTNRIALSLDAISGAGILYAARRLRVEAAGRLIPIMGVLSAFVFAAQMLNFPILGGTSGHLIGGALLAILLGPMAGFMTLATVIIAQALFLQDGGLVALGANLFNIGAVTTWSGYCAYRLLNGSGANRKRLMVAAFAAGWLSLMLSAVSCALQLALSGVIPLAVGLPAMCGYHALIGLIEGALTAGVLSFVTRVRPDLVRPADALRGFADWAGAVVFVAIPYVILILAGGSNLPDPLEKLLAASGTRGGEQGILARDLLSPERLQSYAGLAAVFILVIALIYLAGSLLQEKKGRL